jgi:hypothetical protein
VIDDSSTLEQRSTVKSKITCSVFGLLHFDFLSSFPDLPSAQPRQQFLVLRAPLTSASPNSTLMAMSDSLLPPSSPSSRYTIRCRNPPSIPSSLRTTSSSAFCPLSLLRIASLLQAPRRTQPGRDCVSRAPDPLLAFLSAYVSSGLRALMPIS